VTGPKTLTFDIERCPHLSWHFGTRDVRIGPGQNVIPSRTICWAAKWRDKRTVMFHAEWEDSHRDMLQGIRDLLDEADVVVGYNSDNFDLPVLRWEFQQAGIEPPSPFVSVDLYKVIRREFKSAPFNSTLAYITNKLSLSGKLETGGYYELWASISNPDDPNRPRNLARFRRYNKRDVVTTEELLDVLESRVLNIPSVALYAPEVPSVEIPPCPRCEDGGRPTRQGYKRTKLRRYAQYQCQACGRWFSETRSEMGVTTS
jgi:DNA polymerase elongation subunit (family B)